MGDQHIDPAEFVILGAADKQDQDRMLRKVFAVIEEFEFASPSDVLMLGHNLHLNLARKFADLATQGAPEDIREEVEGLAWQAVHDTWMARLEADGKVPSVQKGEQLIFDAARDN